MKTWPLIGAFVFFCAAAPLRAQNTHRFYDKTAKIEVAANWLVGGADLAETCYALGNRSHEDWIPVQSCAGLLAAGVAGQLAQESFAYFLHRRGHHKLERAVRFISLTGNAAGLVYSHKHGSF
jgi:hypothetical protein